MGNQARLPEPNWEEAVRTYSWLGAAEGKQSTRLRNVHDVSDGGLFVAVAECLIARGFGAKIEIPQDASDFGGCDLWELCYGEGFHSFVVSSAESDTSDLESEWLGLGIPFLRLGRVTNHRRIEVIQGEQTLMNVEIEEVRSAWNKTEYFE